MVYSTPTDHLARKDQSQPPPPIATDMPRCMAMAAAKYLGLWGLCWTEILTFLPLQQDGTSEGSRSSSSSPGTSKLASLLRFEDSPQTIQAERARIAACKYSGFSTPETQEILGHAAEVFAQSPCGDDTHLN